MHTTLSQRKKFAGDLRSNVVKKIAHGAGSDGSQIIDWGALQAPTHLCGELTAATVAPPAATPKAMKDGLSKKSCEASTLMPS